MWSRQWALKFCCTGRRSIQNAFILRNVSHSHLIWQATHRGLASMRRKGDVLLPKYTTVSQLATLLQVRLVDLQTRMEALGYAEKGSDHIVDDENAQLIADDLGIAAKINADHGEDIWPQPPLPAGSPEAKPRPPIVALMGHVDHGKTTLLDWFRSSHVVAGEKGGITQHIGAFLTPLKSNPTQKVCFLDTPGHEAFLKLRQRGANATDIVMLVVAADDSVMPQTREAIKHARSSGVPMVVALTKTDRPDANPDRVVADLAAAGVDVEAYGGETQCVPVSVPANKGLEDLEASLLALVEVLDLRASQKGPVEGVIVESQPMRGLGNAATMIIRRGTLEARTSVLVAGTTWARARQISDDAGKPVRKAVPGTPVRVAGWRDLPEPGDTVLAARDDAHAKRVVANRLRLAEAAAEAKQVEVMNENRRNHHEEVERQTRHAQRAALGLADDTKNTENESTAPKEVLYLIKADVGGSAEAMADSVAGLGNNEVKAVVLHSSAGPVTENDVFLAETAGASILAFASTVSRPVERLAERQGVKVRRFDVIYKAMEAVVAELVDQLPAQYNRRVLAVADIREVFRISVKKTGHKFIAGIKVGKGSFTSRSSVQVRRGSEVVYEGKLASIQHGKDQVDAAHKNSEYGVSFDSWSLFKAGDVLEAYEDIALPRHL